MKKLIIASLLALVPLGVMAEETTLISKNTDGSYAKLSGQKCESALSISSQPEKFQAIIKKIEEYDGWKKATVFEDGKLHNACWTLVKDEILFIFEDGEQGAVPANQFSKEQPL